MQRHEYADVNGVRLHYVAEGEGDLILFLHGFPEFWYAWRRQLAEFGRDHLAVAPDMRGYNLSSRPAEVEQYGIGRLVDDVVALADHLGHERFTLVGHDWGAIVAWSVAIRRPERLKRLVVLNISHPALFNRDLRENPAQQQASQYMLMFRSPQGEAQITGNNFAFAVEGVLGDGIRQGLVTEDDRKAYMDAWSQPGAITGGLNYYRAARFGPPGPGQEVGGSNILDDVSNPVVDLPVLVIWGERDPFLLTSNLNGLEEYAPNLTIHRVPDATHWIVREKPELVNSLIREFIQKHPA